MLDSGKAGTHKTVKARLWSWHSKKKSQNLFCCSRFARQRAASNTEVAAARRAHFFSSLFLSSLELRDTKVYAPETRARLSRHTIDTDAGLRRAPPRSGTNMAHVRQTQPSSGLDFQIQNLNIFYIASFFLESGQPQRPRWRHPDRHYFYLAYYPRA